MAPIRVPTAALMAVMSWQCTAAQPCLPEWDGAIGTPGLGDYRAEALHSRAENGSRALYVAGSFTQAGGLSTRGVARLDLGTGTWSALGGGCYTPASYSNCSAIAEYDFGAGIEILVGGLYTTAGGSPNTANLARWDGQFWTGVPGGQPDLSVRALVVWNGRLYAGGGFTTIGGVAAKGIASYSPGEGWRPLGSGMGSGLSPEVLALLVYNDGTGEKLYAAGRFDSIGGVYGRIGRWTGSAWESIGLGVTGDRTRGVGSLAAYNDGTVPSLYAGGYDMLPNGTGPVSTVVKWDGSKWSRAGTHIEASATSLLAWDDGAGPRLYACIVQPVRLEGGSWVTVGGGLTGPSLPPYSTPSAMVLGMLGNDLVLGGSFTHLGTTAANGLVIRKPCAPCAADLNGDGLVDFADYLEFLNYYDIQDPRVDFNGDGFVDFTDYLEFLNHYDAGC